MGDKRQRHSGRNQQLIIFFGALFLFISLIHRQNDPESGKSLGVIGKRGVSYAEVSGEVRNPGIYDFHGVVTVYDAIERAGGPTKGLIIDETVCSERLDSGQWVSAERISGKRGRVVIKKMAPKEFIILSIPIDINTATREELTAIPGLGPSISGAIINCRKKKGKFSVMDELKAVKGVGKVKYERIKEYVFIN